MIMDQRPESSIENLSALSRKQERSKKWKENGRTAALVVSGIGIAALVSFGALKLTEGPAHTVGEDVPTCIPPEELDDQLPASDSYETAAARDSTSEVFEGLKAPVCVDGENVPVTNKAD